MGIAILISAIIIYITSLISFAIRDVPEVVRILWSSDDTQLRCVYPKRRSANRLWLDSVLKSNHKEKRLRRAALIAEKLGIVIITDGVENGDFSVSINPKFLES